MTAESVFAAANTIALVAWIVLTLFQRRKWATDWAVLAAVTLFATAYVAIIALRWWGSTGGFSSLSEVAALFSDRWLLLAGWLHYLAFDLLVGRWEVRDASNRMIAPWLVAPFLALTFMFGPAGWMSYILLRRAFGADAVTATSGSSCRPDRAG
jgi:hypothetical protein